ncbi:hypothetical protein Ga0074812_13914 [Parafrankia irregularis]|uniref:Uncharacterized protein n=1 Tax=Parafrankia irregularis TaxID=795642 RepID=A0A0S4QXX5_9ACTN|nr:hypothetical protein [Parafrankia irregularis]MBE3206418.1 hypothetical protein [Parafrankia sp. CH37]CUU60381.1 hypothetical protein Ga0074812_13914 [Parafrankia irregularis]
MVRYYVVRRSLFGTLARCFFWIAMLVVGATTVQWAATSMAPAMLGACAVFALGLGVFWVIGRGRSR